MALRKNKIGKLVVVAGALASMVGLSGCGGMSVKVDEAVAARTLKWTDYKNRYYKANDGATKVLVFTSESGNQLAYPFTTAKERKFIELKTYAFDKLVFDPMFDYASTEVLSADSYSFDRQAQINEILRILSIDKPDSKTIKSWEEDINISWLAEMKLDEVKKKAIADAKAEKEARAKQALIERKKADRKIANGQGLEL